MEYRQVGASDVHVSLIGLGTNNFNLRLDAVQSARVVRAALDVGVTYFDTADIYGKRGGAERFLGEALGKDRQRVVLGTKFGIDMDKEGLKRGASRRYIVQAVEASLQRLGTDWIDIYHIHHDDPETPLEETLGALDDLVRAGKIRHSACSNFSKRRLEEGINIARLHGFSPWVAVQDELSLLRHDNVDLLLPVTGRAGLGFLAFPHLRDHPRRIQRRKSGPDKTSRYLESGYGRRRSAVCA